jgi:hypothetical protein
MKKILSKFQRFPLTISATVLPGVFLLFGFPSLAQVYPQIIPRIETIKSSSENLPPAYRLIISQPQDRLYVVCPSGFAPKLKYVRNVEAIQCERFTTP